MNPILVFLTLSAIIVFIPASLYALNQFFRWTVKSALPYTYTENELLVSMGSMAMAVIVWTAAWIFFWTVCVKYLPIN